MTIHEEKALALFREGYNCSQAVMLAFCDVMDMDETQEQLNFVQSHKKIPVTLTVQKEKTCDGCLFQQYPRITVCQECSRYYSDNYVKE